MATKTKTKKANARKRTSSGRFAPVGKKAKGSGKRKSGSGSKKSSAQKRAEVIRSSNRQTGGSNKKRDQMRSAEAPGKRRSETGRVYYEYRKNRSDKPGSLTGIGRVSRLKSLSLTFKKMVPRAMVFMDLQTGYTVPELLKAYKMLYGEYSLKSKTAAKKSERDQYRKKAARYLSAIRYIEK